MKLCDKRTPTCPNCGRFFEYKQKYTHDPIGYEDMEDVTEDEE